MIGVNFSFFSHWVCLTLPNDWLVTPSHWHSISWIKSLCYIANVQYIQMCNIFNQSKLHDLAMLNLFVEITLQIFQICVCLFIFTTGFSHHAFRTSCLSEVQNLWQLPAFLPLLSFYATFSHHFVSRVTCLKIKCDCVILCLETFINCLLYTEVLSLMYNAFGICLTFWWGRWSLLQLSDPPVLLISEKHKSR